MVGGGGRGGGVEGREVYARMEGGRERLSGQLSSCEDFSFYLCCPDQQQHDSDVSVA